METVKTDLKQSTALLEDSLEQEQAVHTQLLQRETALRQQLQEAMHQRQREGADFAATNDELIHLRSSAHDSDLHISQLQQQLSSCHGAWYAHALTVYYALSPCCYLVCMLAARACCPSGHLSVLCAFGPWHCQWQGTCFCHVCYDWLSRLWLGTVCSPDSLD